MKKQYITPITAAVVAIATDAVLTTASGVFSKDFDIDYGGIDEDGTQVPGARLHHSIWDDEEDEF